MRFFWGFPDSSTDKKSICQCRRPWFDSCVEMIPWRRDRLPTQVFLDFPCGSAVKESTCNAGDPGSIPGLWRSPGEGIGYPLRYSWGSLVAQLVKNLLAMWEIWVGYLGWEDPLEKGISSILAWRIPWKEEPGRLQSIESQRIGHDWVIRILLVTLFCL